MRTSFKLSKQIEDYLSGILDQDECKKFENKIAIDAKLAETVKWQKEVQQYVHWYSRKKLREEISMIDDQLFHHSRHLTFQHKIRQIFST